MFGILNLDDRIVQLSLTAGSLNIHVRHMGPDQVFEVDTPTAAISLLRPGDYRFLVDGDKNLTVVTVRSGESEVTGGGAAFRIHPAQTASLSGVDASTAWSRAACRRVRPLVRNARAPRGITGRRTFCVSRNDRL